MNAVGQLGELIIQYQYDIEVGLLVVLALIVVIALVTMISKSIGRKKLIKTIDGKVDDLNAAVTDINAQVAAIMDKQNQLLEKGTAAPELAEKVPAGEAPAAVEKAAEPVAAKATEPEPEKPAEPEKPVVAEKPAEPEKPAVAEQPTEKEEPAAKEEPVEAEKSVAEAAEMLADVKEERRRSWLDDHDWPSEDRAPARSGANKFALAEELKALDQRWMESENSMREAGRGPARRYYSTDCAVDKHGNVYTEEELKQQIY